MKQPWCVFGGSLGCSLTQQHAQVSILFEPTLHHETLTLAWVKLIARSQEDAAGCRLSRSGSFQGCSRDACW